MGGTGTSGMRVVRQCVGSGDGPSPRDPPAKRRPSVVPGGLRAHTCVVVSPPPWGGVGVAGPEVVPGSLLCTPSKAPRWYPLHTVRVLCGSVVHGEETKRRAA